MTDSRFTATFWDQRYDVPERLWSGDPNPALVEETASLTPGTALDVGCGEGADALWLADRGWRVTGVDFAANALRRAAAHTPQRLADRVTWQRADVRTLTTEPGTHDLVTASFLHFPNAVRRPVFAALAGRVAPGGRLVIIGHHPGDLDTAVPRPYEPDLFPTAEDLATDLSPAQWTVLSRPPRPRTVTLDGEPVTVHDAVLHARRTA